MDKKLTRIIIGIVLVFFMTDAFAQTVQIDGDFRQRFENRHGYNQVFPSDAQGANFISQRSRLKLFYGADKFKVGFSLQNVGVWGENNQLTKTNVNGTMVHEAWGEVLFSEIVSLKVGRQEIIYDDHRIFGSVDWTMQGRSHDAAIFKLKPNDKHKVDVGLAYNAVGESLVKVDYPNKNYKSFQYVHWHGNFDAIGVSFLFLNNGIAYQSYDSTNTAGSVFSTEKITYSQTIGPRVSFKKEKLKANAAFYLQTGNVKSAGSGTAGADSTMKLSAMYFAIDASYAVHENISIGVGVEYLSGNDLLDAERTDENAFVPFYGTNHKFNGWMDYFYVKNWGYGAPGLLDIYFPLKYKKGKFSAILIPHLFSAASDIPDIDDPTKAGSKGLGTELDLGFGYNVAKGADIKAGFSFFSPTEAAVGKDYNETNTWGWVMLVFKPAFYHSK